THRLTYPIPQEHHDHHPTHTNPVAVHRLRVRATPARLDAGLGRPGSGRPRGRPQAHDQNGDTPNAGPRPAVAASGLALRPSRDDGADLHLGAADVAASARSAHILARYGTVCGEYSCFTPCRGRKATSWA